MNLSNSQNRVSQIGKLQAGFDARLLSTDKTLALNLVGAVEEIYKDPFKLSEFFLKFQATDYKGLLTQFGNDILKISGLNDDYFKDAVGQTAGTTFVNLDKFAAAKKKVGELLTDRFGITPGGKIVSGGVFDLFTKDATIRAQLQQFAYAQKAAGIGLNQFKTNFRAFIEGDLQTNNPNIPKTGIVTRHFNTFAYDTYQQVDRVAQVGFASSLGMTAFLYLGGIIGGSRQWCKVRDGKCFINSEIKLFGTPTDKYGGYEDKSKGYFSGKPKAFYDPFSMLGGYGCRHHLSALSNKEALLRRPDGLFLGKDGALTIEKPKPVKIAKPKTPKVPKAPKAPKPLKAPKEKKPTAAEIKEAQKHITGLPRWNLYKVEVNSMRYKNYFPDMKVGDAAVTYGYTTNDFYEALNEYLRNYKPGDAVSKNFNSLKLALNKALSKIKPYVGEVYRGTKLPDDVIETYRVAYEGRVAYQEKQFMSTSDNINKAFGGSVKYKIQSKTGVHIEKLSAYGSSEAEVLMPAGKYYEITSFKQVNGTTYIEMTEL